MRKLLDIRIDSGYQEGYTHVKRARYSRWVGGAKYASSSLPNQAPQVLCDTTGASIQVSQYSVPALADWDADGLPDLLVGEKTADGHGQVLLYRNVGTRQKPAFEPGVPLMAGGQVLSVRLS